MSGITIRSVTYGRQAKVQECGNHQGKGKEAGQQRHISEPSPVLIHEMSLPLEIKLEPGAGFYSMTGNLMQMLSQ